MLTTKPFSVSDKDLKISSLFLSNVTCLDHAFCCVESNYTIQGGSFLASFVVTGKIDPLEQVVVDFSTLKGDIKKIIDDRNIGLDHKLWVFPHAWNHYEEYLDSSRAVDNLGSRVMLANETVELDVPRNAIALILEKSEESQTQTQGQSQSIEPKKDFYYNIKNAEIIVQNLLQSNLEKKYEGIDIKCQLTENPDIAYCFDSEDLTSTEMFRYSHGLKDSTSWACTSPVHGHLSFVTFHYPKSTKLGSKYRINLSLSDFISRIKSAVYIYQDNIVDSYMNTLAIQYITKDRGLFRVNYNKVSNKLIILPKETTIENLLTSLLEEFVDITNLKELGVTRVTMSEGLSKGSTISL